MVGEFWPLHHLKCNQTISVSPSVSQQNNTTQKSAFEEKLWPERLAGCMGTETESII